VYLLRQNLTACVARQEFATVAHVLIWIMNGCGAVPQLKCQHGAADVAVGKTPRLPSMRANGGFLQARYNMVGLLFCLKMVASPWPCRRSVRGRFRIQPVTENAEVINNTTFWRVEYTKRNNMSRKSTVKWRCPLHTISANPAQKLEKVSHREEAFDLNSNS
jgi:hypothetical protein